MHLNQFVLCNESRNPKIPYHLGHHSDLKDESPMGL